MPCLHELHVFVEVNALSYQIQWGFGHKLRVLKLRGPLWEQMASDALQGLEGLELTNKKVTFDHACLIKKYSIFGTHY